MANEYPGFPIRSGSQHADAVKAIQSRLKELRIPESSGGKPLVIDGIFGPSSEAALMLFQSRSLDSKGRALEVDGIAGPMTWAALFDQKPSTFKVHTGCLLSQVIDIAASQVGVLEDAGRPNRGEKVDEYVRSTGLNPEGGHAWCVCFLYWCFAEAAKAAGVANPMPKTAGVLDLWNKAGNSGLMRIGHSHATANPQSVTPGMIFILDTGGGFGHAGLVKSIQGVTLRTIEGNTTNKSGSREGIGVFDRNVRKIASINKGFIDVTRKF